MSNKKNKKVQKKIIKKPIDGAQKKTTKKFIEKYIQYILLTVIVIFVVVSILSGCGGKVSLADAVSYGIYIFLELLSKFFSVFWVVAGIDITRYIARENRYEPVFKYYLNNKKYFIIHNASIGISISCIIIIAYINKLLQETFGQDIRMKSTIYVFLFTLTIISLLCVYGVKRKVKKEVGKNLSS